MKNYKTGYYAWIGTEKTWHRTFEGAERAIEKAGRGVDQWRCQIIEVATGDLVWGNPQ